MIHALDPNRTLFVHVHWMKHYDGRPDDEPHAGGQSRDGSMEDYNFLDYAGNVFGGFWPGRIRKADDHARDVSIDRLEAAAQTKASGITVLFFAPHPDDGRRRFVGWYDNATVYHRIREHPDDGQPYNLTTTRENAHLIPYRQRARVFDFSRWWKQGTPRRPLQTVPGVATSKCTSPSVVKFVVV
jgi:hypothetical protein